MLRRLTINNYALIRELEIEFNEPFSVITGETGAGKSIILGALSLILGNRVDHLVLPDTEKKCFIEGSFDIAKCDLEPFFEENNLDYDQICIIRREITASGKSRAFINDTPVNLNQLKDLTSKLIDVHSQHQTLLLKENSFQLSIIDQVADNQKLIKKYKELYKNHNKLKSELNELTIQSHRSKTEIDYIQFIVDEFNNAALKIGEQETLEEELNVQSHAEEIKTRLYNAIQILANDEKNIISGLREVNSLVSAATKHYAELNGVKERLDSCVIELKDINEYLNDTVESISFDPQRIDEINSRLSQIYKLQQKHQVNNIEKLLELANDFENKIQGIELLDDKLAKLKEEVIRSYDDLMLCANELSNKRKEVSGFIESSIINTVSQVGIKNAIFKISWTNLDQPQKDGIDSVRFLFTANKGGVPDDISKIASGGELSRLMLAVKSLISTNNILPTIIFDEIDTGISGDIAGRVGNILLKIAANMQVITITHLPQIAALGHEHFKVLKLNDDDSTFSTIKKLDSEEQIDELALMISGNNLSQVARETAQELKLQAKQL